MIVAPDDVDLSTSPDAAAGNARTINGALRDRGGRVLLPAGRYPVAETIVVPDVPGAGIAGAGMSMTTLVQAPGADLDALVATERWLTGGEFSQEPCVVADLTLDGGRDEQSGGLGHGLVLMAYGSVVQRVAAVATRGDGFHLANGNRDGRKIDNDAVENRFLDCAGRFNGGYGLHAPYTEGDGPPGTTDTYVDRFVCEAPDLGYVRSDRAGGWKVLAAQCYSSADVPASMGHGIELRSCFGTTVANCNIDTWGAGSAGLFLQGLSGRPSVVSANVFDQRAETDDDGAALWLEAAGGHRPDWTVVGNAVSSRAEPSRLAFLRVTETGGDGTNHGQVTGNSATGGVALDASASAVGARFSLEANSFNRADGRPETGFWPAGTVVRSSSVGADGVVGWVCTAAGSPGTWSPLRAG